MDAASRTAALAGDEARHATRVLRLRPGDPVRVFDGLGREWAGRIATVPDGARVLLDRELPAAPEPPVRVAVAVALLKGDELDTVVRDATMLGAAGIQPIVTARSVVPRRARLGPAVERWRRVAVASAKQCGRAVVPAIAEPAELTAVLGRWSGQAIVMCAEPAAGGEASTEPGERLAAPPSGERPSLLLLCGPEGGWSPEEVAQVAALGGRLWRLGPRVLRADAAPAVALTALWAAWGWE